MTQTITKQAYLKVKHLETESLEVEIGKYLCRNEHGFSNFQDFLKKFRIFYFVHKEKVHQSICSDAVIQKLIKDKADSFKIIKVLVTVITAMNIFPKEAPIIIQFSEIILRRLYDGLCNE